MLQFKLPAAHSIQFQQARHRALHQSVLGCGAIFCYKKNDGLQDSARASFPCGEGRDGHEEPTSQLHTCMEGKVIEEIPLSFRRARLAFGGALLAAFGCLLCKSCLHLLPLHKALAGSGSRRLDRSCMTP